MIVSPSGKECLLEIHTAGDLFGELCMSDLGSRQETATAMQPTVVRRIPCSEFFARLSADSLVEGFVRYLAVRISDQQSLISNLVTIDSEQRLGWTLLQLAHKLGEKGARGSIIRQRITQEELSGMVGTTRPRISAFLRKLRELKLIELSEHRFLIVKEKRLAAYLRNNTLPNSA